MKPAHVEIPAGHAWFAGSNAAHPHLMMYKCVAKPWVMRLGALLLGAASFMVVWSEATIGLGRKPDVSPFSLVTALSNVVPACVAAAATAVHCVLLLPSI